MQRTGRYDILADQVDEDDDGPAAEMPSLGTPVEGQQMSARQMRYLARLSKKAEEEDAQRQSASQEVSVLSLPCNRLHVNNAVLN